jgi:TGF-beta receptor type-2
LPDSNATAFQNLSGEQDLPFQLGHLISRGRFGYVYRTQYEDELVAVKIFSYQNRQSWETERDLFAMESTKHRNVVEYVVSGSWGSGYQLQMFIVTPFYLLGSLNRFLARNAVSWEQACRVIHSVSNGLSHLHAESYTNSSGVVMEKYAVAHRDVKSANILVRGENGDCVIADLGFALILDPAKDDKDMANTGQVGTYRYMAPEVLDARVDLHNTQAFKQIDVYALALVMWEVVWRCNVHEEQSPQDYMMAYEDSVGQRPGIDTMRDIVCTQKLRPQITPSWRNHIGLSSLLDTIEECWDEDPEARLSASNVVLRLKELLDGGPTALTSDHTLSHTFTHSSVIPGNERFWRGEAQESTTDTIGTTDSRPPPYDNRWANTGGSDESFSGSMGLNLDETTV